ncbi:hypothetical protein GCM10009836_43910 [Pseudonocardia ailaonensis]|uniref:Ketoreductase domain-containing protein n=1 Tax=Pseudonocardia ailaonensis TaxID=367279 RepID=A0ABN2N9F0_9PSEU
MHATNVPSWRRALITGGTGGIGSAIAARLSASGTEVVLVGQRPDRLAESAATLGGAETIICDLSGDGVSVLEQRLASEESPVDLLVNCAGYTVVGPFHGTDLPRTLDMLSVNTMALVRLTHAAATAMAGRGDGTILNISSRAGFGPRAGAACYGASKAFVNIFSLALAEELAQTGVRVVCVAPGATSTDFFQRAGLDMAAFNHTVFQTPEEVAEVCLKAIGASDRLTLTSQENADAISRWIADISESFTIRPPG